MRRIFIISILVIASMLFTHAQTKNDYRDEKVERELIELVRMWDAAIIKHDTITLGHLLADEFTLSGVPKTDYLASVKSSNAVVESAYSSNFEVRVYKEKEMAVLIAIDTITTQRNNVRMTGRYRYIDVWIKREGRWQCIVTESHQISNQ